MTRVGTIPVDLVIPDLNVEQRYDAIKIETTPIRKKRQKIVTISVLIFVLPTSVRRFQSIPLVTNIFFIASTHHQMKTTHVQ